MEPYLAGISSPYEHVRLSIHDAKPVSVSVSLRAVFTFTYLFCAQMRFHRERGVNLNEEKIFTLS